MEFETLELEREGSILRVWLNRPRVRNALSTRSLEEITALFTGLQTDFAVTTVVLGGRGASFCAGADRGDPPGLAATENAASDRERRYASQMGARACRAIEDVDAVTVARIHGHAIGGGLLLALACDFRIASAETVFHVPEVDLGIPLTWGGTPRLIHELGAARAREIILMCERVDAATAQHWGLVHRCVAEKALDATVEDWVARLAAKPEVAVHMTKTQMRSYAARGRLGDVTETDGDVLRGALHTAQARESFRRR